MPHADDAALRSRVLILAPIGRDAVLTKSLLSRAGSDSHICSSLRDLKSNLTKGAGAAIIAEEALMGQNIGDLAGWITQQPSWSDFPFIILLEPAASAESGGRERQILQGSGNLTLLERPVGTATLVSAVSAALRARRRQFQVHDALDALTVSERRYRTLAEALPQLVWTSQPNGHRDYFSKQWLEYTGIPEKEQLGLAWLDKVVHPEDRERIRERWLAAVREPDEYDAELRIRRADGAYRWFKARGTPVRDRDRIVKWFGTCTDITDIVEARETLARSREELEQLVADRTRSLAAANARGIVLIAAAGNAGPKSPPLYPAADPNVIAVTATDADDQLFAAANRGGYIAVAAPGVDLLLPAPGPGYQMASGTSFAAAEVSGAVALLLERKADLDPQAVRRALMSTARDLGPKGIDPQFGAGLVDAYQAILSLPAGTVGQGTTIGTATVDPR